MYKVIFSKQALKDLQKLKSTNLSLKTKKITEIIAIDPFQNPPPYEKLVGNLSGYYSRRINIKHRFVYDVDETQKTVHVLSMWTHYENL